MNKFFAHWFSYSLIVVWLVVCIICQKVDLVSRLANKGMQIINSEYYRFATTLFLHKNFIHVLANTIALFFVGKYLESQINPAKLLIFSVLIGIITEAVFASIYRNSVSMGGSPVVFALIGLIVAIQIMKTDYQKFQLGTWYGNGILAYAVLTNIPIFSTSFVSTLLIHGMPMVFGVLLGCLFIGLNLF